MKSEKNFEELLLQIGYSIAALREKNGYSSIDEFSSKFSLPTIHYWRIEHGQANLTLRMLTTILSVHKISLQDFFCMVIEDEKRKAAG